MSNKDLGEGIENFEEEVENLKNKEFRLFGIKVTAVTIGMAFSLISAGIGSLYGAFVVYQDYMDMRERIETYEAPDLSGFQEQLSILNTRLDNKLIQVESNVEVIAKGYRAELDDIKSDLDNVENLARDVDDSVAETQRDLRNDVYELEQRVNDSLRQVDSDVRKVREDLEEKIQTVLENPLNDVD